MKETFTAVSLNRSQQSYKGLRCHFVNELWPSHNCQQLFVIAQCTHSVGLWILVEFCSCCLHRSTLCVRLKSAHHVMGLVSRDASANDGRGKLSLCPELAHHTLVNSGKSHANTHEWAPFVTKAAQEPVFSIWQQGDDLVMRRILNYLLGLIRFLFFSYDTEDARSWGDVSNTLTSR